MSTGRPSTVGETPSEITPSADYSGSTEGGAGTVVGSSEQIELATMEEGGHDVERGV
jgi:hypothetical protein